MSEWKNIKSAPHGKKILLCGCKRLPYCVGYFQNGEWLMESTSDLHNIYTPTHWMDLPDHPKDKK